MSDAAAGRLWVLWRPAGEKPAADQPVLSFLSPPEEESLEKSCRLIRAREVVQDVREAARSRYLRLVANIGLARLSDGRTLRQALARPGEASRWWFHPVSFKDPDGSGDRAYDWLLTVETVRAAAARSGALELFLWGAPAEVEAVLAQGFSVRSRAGARPPSAWATVVGALASRLKGLALHLRQLAAARLVAKQAIGKVAIFGFWDWSVRRTEKGALFDRYFKALPDELSRLGVTSGWLLWLDPDFDPARSGRSASEVAKTLDPAPHAALLQSWLSFSDVWAATRDFSPFRVYLRARRSPALAAALSEEGIDYSAFFAARLLRGFLDTSLPHFQLVTLAAERALKAAGSKVAVSFFEHWSYGRAFAEGARRAGAISAAMQHASVCWEKTFHRLEPEHEFHGKPDGCAAPKPSFLFAAGAAGKAVYEESGHRPENVFLTGSARYDHICEPAAALPPRRSPLTVLLALSLEGDIEIEMIEAACIAARGADGVRLECRNYPFTRIEERPRFRRLAKEIGVTGGTLDEDLARADLILVSYSTVGEEALIAGKPVWQWLPAGYFGSGLAEAVEIPRFASPASLREALLRFAKDPALFQPTMELRRRALELLFFRGDGQAAARIAEKVKELSLKRP